MKTYGEIYALKQKFDKLSDERRSQVLNSFCYKIGKKIGKENRTLFALLRDERVGGELGRVLESEFKIYRISDKETGV